MKKIILNAVAVLFLLGGSVQAQQMIVDLSTGDPLLNVPLGGGDPIWKIKKPGTNTYVSAFITNGHDFQYHTQNPYQTWNKINPYPRVISPNINAQNEIMIAAGAEHIYRMQFNFNKNCNTITSAKLVVDGILTGDAITGILLNGYSLNWPYASQPAATNYIEIWKAYAAPSTLNPFTTTIPQEIINLNPGDFANGLNNFFIRVDPSLSGFGIVNNHTGALMIKAHLEINYTNVGVNNLYFNMSGSNNTICNGHTANLNIGLNVSPIANYWLDVNPGGISQSAASSQLVQVTPNVTTTYAIKITNQVTGCATQLNWPVTVLHALGPDLMGYGSTEQICFGIDQAYMNVTIPGHPTGYPFQVYDVTNNVFLPNGTNNSSYLIYPTVPTHYQVIFNDLITGCVSTTDWFVGVNYPDPITGVCISNLKVIQPKVGITTMDMVGKLNIVPNPSNGIFSINTDGISNGQARVFNLSGTLIYETTITKEITNYSIDLTGYPQGIYLINYDAEGIHTSKKVVLE